MTVSVIIPIYNGEKYIEKMYDSLCHQTYQDFEIIYINDGSTDNSLFILDSIAHKDDRVIVFSQKNQGICASRNRGIENAQGKYIIFLDQDDGIEGNLIEKYVWAIEEKNADMASFGKIHYYVDHDEIVSIKPQIVSEETVEDKQRLVKCLFNLDNQKRLMTIWNCIYRREMILDNNIRFDEHFKHGDEDGMFNIEYALICNRIYFSKDCYYHYYIRKGISTITKYNEELLENYLYYANKVNLLTKGMKEDDLNIVRLYLLRFFSNVYGRFCKFTDSINEKKQFIEETRKSQGFAFATSLNVFKNRKELPIKYIYWDLFNLFYRSKKDRFAIAALDLLLSIKERKSK